MAYDTKTYGTSPFGQSVTTKTTAGVGRASSQENRPIPKTTTLEALSDQLAEDETNQLEDPPSESAPTLPADYAIHKKEPRRKTVFYIPKGRIANLTLLGEALGWLMAWGTVGFFRAHLPAPFVAFFDRLFSPWGMTALTLASGLFIGRIFRDYRVQVGRLRNAAVLAIEYGEVEHRADAQQKIDQLLREAEVKTERVGRWLVTWLTALGCLFIIGAFY